MVENKKPAIRFRGFTEKWEQHKVKELCSVSTGKSNTQDKIDNGEYPFYVRSSIIERSIKYLYDEEAVLTVGDGVGTGKVFHYVNGKYDLHQRCYRMFEFSDKLNAKYFYHIFSLLFYKRVMAMTAKTSVDSVRYEMIADMDIPVPSIAEQKKIAVTIDNLDKLITLHRRKHEKLQNIKKSILEKMVPQNRKSVLEIRFKEFKGAWEQQKLGEYVEFYNGDRGINYPQKSDMVREGIPFINAGDLIDGHVFLQGSNKITKQKFEQLSGAKIKRGDILYCLRGTLGKNAFIDNFDIGTVASSLVDIRPKNIDGRYLFYILNSDIEYRQRCLSNEGAAQPNLSAKNLSEFDIPIPSFAEQVKIGEYFKNFNNLITFHKHKIEKLQAIKKSFLEKMFI